MNISNEVLVVLLSSIVLLLTVGLLAILWGVYFARSKRERETSIAHQINNMQEKLFKFQLDHPEVLSLGRQWSSDKISRVYQQDTAEDRQWAIYYTFIELCIAYCNTVLYAKNRKLLDILAYQQQHEPMVKLILREHQSIIDDLMRDNRYVSLYLKEFKDLLVKTG